MSTIGRTTISLNMTSGGHFLRLSMMLLIATIAGRAWAQDDPPATPNEDRVVAACLASFDKSQALRAEKKLLEAKQELVACSQQSCPDVVNVKCQQWLGEVKTSIPSVVVTAKDEGKDIFDVQVFIDDKLMLESLDGTALELDVGPRKIKAVRGDETRERTVLISEGVKNRMVEFVFKPPKPPPPPPTDPFVPEPTITYEPGGPGYRLPILSWIGFTVSFAGVVAGSITGGIAISRFNDLEPKCPGSECKEGNVDEFSPAEAISHASTVSFAIGGAGIILGVIGLFIDDGSDSCQITSRGFVTTF